MTQTAFASNASPSLVLLDQNFTQLYDLREVVSTPGYAASTPYLVLSASVAAANHATVPKFALQVSGNERAYWQYTEATAMARLDSDGGLEISTNNAVRIAIDASGNAGTGVDNTQTWGTAAKRWSTFYAGTGTINTSDAREKTPVRTLADAEIDAAKALAREVGSFQWLTAVAEKGDAARQHIGLTVQRAMQVLEEHGLDPLRYAFICHDAWASSAIDAPAGDRYSFRTDQLLLFIARGFEARLAALEARG
jgi:hypothetical protein